MKGYRKIHDKIIKVRGNVIFIDFAKPKAKVLSRIELQVLEDRIEEISTKIANLPYEFTTDLASELEQIIETIETSLKLTQSQDAQVIQVDFKTRRKAA